MQILIIQTAFIGDVVLTTPLIEKLKEYSPSSRIDFLLRKGNEPLFEGHPKINEVITWNKTEGKWKNFLSVLKKIRGKKYDLVLNVHRYFSSGILTVFSAADQKVGFRANPLSFLFDRAVHHQIDGRHEVERNLELISDLVSGGLIRPKLYVEEWMPKVERFKTERYITISPGSVWATKTLPREKWAGLVGRMGDKVVYLLGARQDKELCEKIKAMAGHGKVYVLAGQLSMLESCALMKDAEMNYVNDSAPLHFASAVNAPVTAVFCSTVPGFGFGPLSDVSKIIESPEHLACRPCGLHGHVRCPEGHFRCGHSVVITDV